MKLRPDQYPSIYPKTGRKANRCLPAKSLSPNCLGSSQIRRSPSSAGARARAQNNAIQPPEILRFRARLGRRFRRRRSETAGTIRGLFLDRLRLGFGLFLRLARHRFRALALVTLIPVARDLSRELPIAQPKRQRERERDRAEEKRERRCDNIGRDAKLL